MDVWTVSDVTRHIRELFDLDQDLQDVWVEGEVSNLTQARSGHLYFTLKDAGAQLKCVMWRWEAAALPHLPEHGDAVRAHGRVSVYEAGGAYQLYADWLKPVGRGDLHRQFEEIKARLEAEGLFDPERKRPIPDLPQRIGVVTSADAAAWRDVQTVLSRRFPLVEVLLAPTLVQGNEAPPQIVRALDALGGRDDVDLIILTRGGGSLEDLWAFNDEMVARAVARCRHPVISGVGHETDFTIADFAADLRAPTPSAAAELATPDKQDLVAQLTNLQRGLGGALSARLESIRWRLDGAARALRVLSPGGRMLNLAQRLDELGIRAERALAGWLRARRQELAGLERALASVNPLATLARGYAIVTRADSDLVVTDSAQVDAGDRLWVQVHRGRFAAEVTE